MSNIKTIFGVFSIFALVLIGGVSVVQAQEDTAAMEEYIKSFATPEEALQALQSEGTGETEAVGDAVDETFEMYDTGKETPDDPTQENSIEETYGKEEKVVEEVVAPAPVEEKEDSFDILLLTTVLFGVLAVVLGSMLYRVNAVRGGTGMSDTNRMNDGNQSNI